MVLLSKFGAPFAQSRLLRLFIVNTVVGYGLAAVFTWLILAQNIAGVGTLVQQVEGGWFAGVLFFLLNGGVFASVQIGIAIWALGPDEPRGGSRLKVTPTPAPVPIPREP